MIKLFIKELSLIIKYL